MGAAPAFTKNVTLTVSVTDNGRSVSNLCALETWIASVACHRVISDFHVGEM